MHIELNGSQAEWQSVLVEFAALGSQDIRKSPPRIQPTRRATFSKCVPCTISPERITSVMYRLARMTPRHDDGGVFFAYKTFSSDTGAPSNSWYLEATDSLNSITLDMGGLNYTPR